MYTRIHVLGVMIVISVMKIKVILSLAAAFLVVGCATNKNDLLRPDLVVKFPPNSAEVANGAVISEAVYGLLENANSEILLVGVASNQHDYDPRLAAERVESLENQLNGAGIPDYKIFKMTRWGRGDDQIEIYGLANGWKSMPTDMMNFAFASDLPKRQLKVVKSVEKLPKKPTKEYLHELLVKEGDFDKSLSEVVVNAGWSEFKPHHGRAVNIEQAFKVLLDKVEKPVSPLAMRQILEEILDETHQENLVIRLHQDERIVVITEEKSE